MTGPSSVKSSTDDDDNEISLIFVLPVMDIELSRAVPRVNKNLKKKKKKHGRGCGATAFQRVSFNSRSCIYFLPRLPLFFFLIHLFSSTLFNNDLLSSAMYSACIKRGSRNWRGINASRKYRFVETSNIPSPFFFCCYSGLKESQTLAVVVINEKANFLSSWKYLLPWSSSSEKLFRWD